MSPQSAKLLAKLRAEADPAIKEEDRPSSALGSDKSDSTAPPSDASSDDGLEARDSSSEDTGFTSYTDSATNVESGDKTDLTLADPFDSEASRVLFDAIDKIQSCGAGEYVDIPQLIVVGGQSTGKSSLLQNLTDFPFPVGIDCCTRFATRIVSRRTPPGTANQVKITIDPPEFKTKISCIPYVPAESYKKFSRVMENLTGKEFAEVIDEVTTNYLGIRPGKRGPGHKNFAVEVLKVEISGPNRSHFSILDIPGIFNNDLDVLEGEMEAVKQMVTEYMSQPANIVICIVDATSHRSNQEILKVADKYVDKTRLIGVFTKCDLLPKAESTVAVANGKVEGVSQLLHHGWFVVRNRSDGDEEADFDHRQAERDLFRKGPWTQIQETRRGSEMLKKYLAALLARRIKEAFPELRRNVNNLLAEAEAEKAMLGNPRDTVELRRSYLADIAQQYEIHTKRALDAPWDLPNPTARVRRRVRDMNEIFNKAMNNNGHAYEFEDHHVAQEEYNRRIKELIQKQEVGTSTEEPAVFQVIRDEIDNCSSTELPGMVHPEVLRRLYKVQTEKWKSMAVEHLAHTAEAVGEATKEILNMVCPSRGATAALHTELWMILQNSHNKALSNAMGIVAKYCDGDQTKPLQTTDVGFHEKLTRLKSVRMLEAFIKANNWLGTNARGVSEEQISLQVLQIMHLSSPDNTIHEIHDTLKVYYEFSLHSFIRHIVTTIVEDFLQDATGQLKVLTRKYVEEMSNNEIDRLGWESSEVVERRRQLDMRIVTLRAAEYAARAALAETGRMG